MIIREFEELRNLPGKYIEDDIKFRPARGTGPNLVFQNISTRPKVFRQFVVPPLGGVAPPKGGTTN